MEDSAEYTGNRTNGKSGCYYLDVRGVEVVAHGKRGEFFRAVLRLLDELEDPPTPKEEVARLLVKIRSCMKAKYRREAPPPAKELRFMHKLLRGW